MPIYLEYFPHWRALLTMQKINEVALKTKVPIINYLPDKIESNEEPKDAFKIIDLKIVGDGSLRMYLKDAKEPIRMFPNANVVRITAYYKRLLPLIAQSLLQMGWIKRIITILAIKYNIGIMPSWFDYIFSLESILLNEENYSQPVKELRRVLKGKIADGFINAITLVIENDSAYRYRFQDFICELDKSKLDGFLPLLKEVNRIFDILDKRETKGGIMDYIHIKKFIILAMVLNKKTRETVRSILKEINLDEIKFDACDLYWINDHKAGYMFCGLTLEERQARNIAKYGSVN